MLIKPTGQVNDLSSQVLQLECHQAEQNLSSSVCSISAHRCMDAAKFKVGSFLLSQIWQLGPQLRTRRAKESSFWLQSTTSCGVKEGLLGGAFQHYNHWPTHYRFVYKRTKGRVKLSFGLGSAAFLQRNYACFTWAWIQPHLLRIFTEEEELGWENLRLPHWLASL